MILGICGRGYAQKPNFSGYERVAGSILAGEG